MICTVCRRWLVQTLLVWPTSSCSSVGATRVISAVPTPEPATKKAEMKQISPRPRNIVLILHGTCSTSRQVARKGERVSEGSLVISPEVVQRYSINSAE